MVGEPVVPFPALPAPSASRRLPWDIHPALGEDRLRICARLLAHARRDAIRMASYEMGDTTWSVGCRAYTFGQQRMRRVAENRTYNWLSVLDQSNHFVFLIQDVPVRFFRGSADEPTARTLRRQHNEAQQLDLALGEDLAKETAIGRYKHLIGPKLRARTLPGQQGEAALAVAVLNRMIKGAKPVTVRRT